MQTSATRHQPLLTITHSHTSMLNNNGRQSTTIDEDNAGAHYEPQVRFFFSFFFFFFSYLLLALPGLPLHDNPARQRSPPPSQRRSPANNHEPRLPRHQPLHPPFAHATGGFESSPGEQGEQLVRLEPRHGLSLKSTCFFFSFLVYLRIFSTDYRLQLTSTTSTITTNTSLPQHASQ